MRLSVTLFLALGLMFVPACDSSSDGDGDTGADSNGDGDGDGDGDGECIADDAQVPSGDPRACGEDWACKDGEGGGTDNQETWGAPCTADQECVDLLGRDDAFCLNDILGVFEVPEGYCTVECVVPDGTTFENDSEQCDPNGGVTCVGINGNFTACAPPCTDHDQCGREGYGCTVLPIIGAAGDPKLCLFNDKACCTEEGTCD